MKQWHEMVSMESEFSAMDIVHAGAQRAMIINNPSMGSIEICWQEIATLFNL